MSTRGRAAVGAARRPAPSRWAALLVLLPLVGSLAVHHATAQPAPQVTRLLAEEARRAGVALDLSRPAPAAESLVEVSAINQSAVAATLLAVAPDGSGAVLAESVGLDPTSLVIARGDGSQSRVAMPGLTAAAFAPDGSWLAALDGAGSLWRVSTADASATRLLDGPFIGPVTVEPEGTLLALAVSSVEAPFVSRPVRIDPAASAVERLAADRLVYAAQRLDDGSVAAVIHQPHGTLVRILDGPRAGVLATLGEDAVNAVVSGDGSRVAWERQGTVFLVELPDGKARQLAAGSAPAFAPDGSSLLVRSATGTQLVGLDGSLLAELGPAVGFAACDEGCTP